MAKVTIAEQLAKGLAALGWTEVTSNSRKYRAFSHLERPYKAFIGKAGGLRVGPNVSASNSASDLFRNAALEKGK